MKERPLIVTTQLIPKVLDGTKIQTRRVVRELKYYSPETWDKAVPHNMYDCPYLKIPYQQDDDVIGGRYSCPYGQVGDRLWVRETFAYESPDGDRYVTVVPNETKILYHATDDWEGVRVPSIFMPRWASRITLEITNLRVERLQEITPNDCVAEGYPFGAIPLCRSERELEVSKQLRLGWYKDIWNSINKDYPFEANPWVWVIEWPPYKKVRP